MKLDYLFYLQSIYKGIAPSYGPSLYLKTTGHLALRTSSYRVAIPAFKRTYFAFWPQEEQEHKLLNWRVTPVLIPQAANFFGLTIRVTKNNLFMVVYEIGGRIVAWLTRNTPHYNFHLYTKVGAHLALFMLARLMLIVKEAEVGKALHCLIIKGRLPIRRIYREFLKWKIQIRTVQLVGNVPHNGCRLPRKRRGARN